MAKDKNQMALRPDDDRVPLSRDRVLRAAVSLTDEGGMDALTMRSLGSRLGVEAMSLYNHVANKDDLLDGMTDLVVDEIELPGADADWRSALRASAVSANRVLRRHPWASGVLISRKHDGPSRLRFMEGVLGCLRRAGFAPEATHHAYHVIDSHILGYTLQEVSFSIPAEDLQSVGSDFIDQLPEGEYRYLIEHVRGHLDGSFEGQNGFEFGLDLILEGLEHRLQAGDRG